MKGRRAVNEREGVQDIDFGVVSSPRRGGLLRVTSDKVVGTVLLSRSIRVSMADGGGSVQVVDVFGISITCGGVPGEESPVGVVSADGSTGVLDVVVGDGGGIGVGEIGCGSRSCDACEKGMSVAGWWEVRREAGLRDGGNGVNGSFGRLVAADGGADQGGSANSLAIASTMAGNRVSMNLVRECVSLLLISSVSSRARVGLSTSGRERILV